MGSCSDQPRLDVISGAYCDRQNNVPLSCDHPNLQDCEYVTLHGKRKCANVIKVRTLRWGDYPGGSSLIT